LRDATDVNITIKATKYWVMVALALAAGLIGYSGPRWLGLVSVPHLRYGLSQDIGCLSKPAIPIGKRRP